MDLFQALALGLVQGLTEWLPVSSSGHLVMAQNLMGLEVPVAFDLMLHLGTLLSVFAFFRRDIAGILRSLLSFDRSSEGFRLSLFVLAGTVPTAIIGLAFLEFFESLFLSTKAVAIGLLVTGVLLALSRLRKGKSGLGLKSSLAMGAFQGMAIAPGISRSGSTISAGLMSGVERGAVFRYSFLLSIPAIIGAGFIEVAREPLVLGDMLAFSLAGAAVAAAAGYAAIRIVHKALMSGRFHYFAVYCFALGAAVLLFF